MTDPTKQTLTEFAEARHRENNDQFVMAVFGANRVVMTALHEPTVSAAMLAISTAVSEEHQNDTLAAKFDSPEKVAHWAKAVFVFPSPADAKNLRDYLTTMIERWEDASAKEIKEKTP